MNLEENVFVVFIEYSAELKIYWLAFYMNSNELFKEFTS